MLCDREKRFEKPPVLFTFCEARRKFCKLIWRKNKLIPLKRSDQMCLQNVGGFTHRSTWILTVWESKPRSLRETCLNTPKAYLIDSQQVLKSQVLLREPQELVRNFQEAKVLKQPLLRKMQELVRKTQLKNMLKKSILREPQEGDLLMNLLVRKQKFEKRKKQ